MQDTAIKILIERHELSDHSEVFDVVLGNTRLHCYSEREARKLADKLSTAIDEHTCDQVFVTEAA